MAKKSKNDRLAVDAYLATLLRAERESLEALRTLIKRALPQAEERVSYGTTVMFSLGRDLVGFVSQPKHLSFFMASPKLAQARSTLLQNKHGYVLTCPVDSSPRVRSLRRTSCQATRIRDGCERRPTFAAVAAVDHHRDLRDY